MCKLGLQSDKMQKKPGKYKAQRINAQLCMAGRDRVLSGLPGRERGDTD